MDGIEQAIAMIMGDARIRKGRLEEHEIPKCDKCGGKKLANIDWPGGSSRIVTTMCDCEREEYDNRKAEHEEAERKAQVERIRSHAIPDDKNRQARFENDDGSNPNVSAICRKYVENWVQMKEDNIGILFNGPVGTGKTYLAACIGNALIDKGVSVKMTNFPTILMQLQASMDVRDEIIKELCRKSLLIIDDLGAERDTSFAFEQVYAVIDARMRANLPLIVTTNLSMTELRNPANIACGRIYDRVIEMCSIALKLDGQSKRIDATNDKRERARRALGLG